ncbi:MAG: hypothetical protein ACI915_005428, partial [Gammaproteobacteria bacterium]
MEHAYVTGYYRVRHLALTNKGIIRMKRTLIFFALLVAASWVQAATLVVHNTG